MAANRNLELTPRKEGVREKEQMTVIVFQLEDIKQHFVENMNAVKRKFVIAEELENGKKEEESEDMFRTQIVFLESAFDFYMHEITQYGLLKIFEGEWDPTDKYRNIQLRMEIVEQALSSNETVDWFVHFVNCSYRTVTMMSWDDVKNQLNLLGMDIKKIADEAFYAAGSREKTRDKLERRINELYERRNQISHQSDRLQQNAEKQKIERQTVENFISDIEKIVNAIHNEAKRMS